LQEAAVAPQHLVLLVAGQVLERPIGKHDRVVGQVGVGEDHGHAGHLDLGEEHVSTVVEAGL